MDKYDYDALIVGSGPIGATYARLLVEAGYKVLMVEAGAQESEHAGEHKKNAVAFQKDIDAFVKENQIYNGQNPKQDPTVNLDANAVARNVGGMSTHWTCATPEQLKGLERSTIFTDDEWTALYKRAKDLIGTRTDVLEDSIRQELVLQILKDEETKKNKDFIIWSSSSTILDPIKDKKDDDGEHLFTLWSQCICDRLHFEDTKDKEGAVKCAQLLHFRTNKEQYVRANKYIICGGSILTPQLLYKSGFKPKEKMSKETPTYLRLPALGHNLTEQTMCFCQIVLNKSWINAVADDNHNPYPNDPQKKEAWEKLRAKWKPKVDQHKEETIAQGYEDPLPFPFNDLDPQVTLPLSECYPWHTQIHRDAFSYGAAPPAIDKRTIVDLRFFGMVKPSWDNCVTFEDDIQDGYGMPQPTFKFTLGEEDRENSHRMMQDMEKVAGSLGGYLPGSEPQFLAPGLALHVCGTTAAGKEKEVSCCDLNSKVWDFNNLYLGGLNVIPGSNGSNPTLTAICFAIQGAEDVVSSLKANK
ncbi:uncharacterized protein N7477_009669 [Penicillium maclennaniae]|uniref:uncharacterized protein n=1 Tax=Penicillium maclennaniae TaxID=1343394 RepID=UPI00253F96A8|nr:uncharacterized protein N7477_009669 [Penicillium maclennaniae]KAJ5662053.1 hypothetical protein N7477_009669 [Penicillium maclennaniae]